MNTFPRSFPRAAFFLLLCGSMFVLGPPTATAGDRHEHGRALGHYKHSHYGKHDRGRHDYGRHDYGRRDHGKRKYGRDRHTVYRERVIVREVPRHHHRPAPVVNNHYYGSPPVHRNYAYSRSPAVVIGVDIPPLVIPLR